MSAINSSFFQAIDNMENTEQPKPTGSGNNTVKASSGSGNVSKPTKPSIRGVLYRIEDKAEFERNDEFNIDRSSNSIRQIRYWIIIILVANGFNLVVEFLPDGVALIWLKHLFNIRVVVFTLSLIAIIFLLLQYLFIDLAEKIRRKNKKSE